MNLWHGLAQPDLALLLNRVTLGTFFVLARFRFFYDPSRKGAQWFNAGRYSSLSMKMRACGWQRGAPFWAWFAAIVEVGAGAFLALGLLSVLSAIGLLAVTVAATWCTAHEKTMKQNPVDRLDCVSCYLWNAEPLYIVMALAVIAAGPGRYSLDYYIGV